MSVTARKGAHGGTFDSRNDGAPADDRELPEVAPPQSAQEAADRINAMFTSGDPALDEKYHRLFIASRTAKSCGDCGRSLAPDEPVWRMRRPAGRGLFGGRSVLMVPFCHGCRSERPHYWYDWQGPDPCAECGRPVYHGPRKPIFCSAHCVRVFYVREANAKAKANRARARDGLTCTVCTRPLTASRRDALTCSPACRQKAYRKRAQEAWEVLAGKGE